MKIRNSEIELSKVVDYTVTKNAIHIYMKDYTKVYMKYEISNEFDSIVKALKGRNGSD